MMDRQKFLQITRVTAPYLTEGDIKIVMSVYEAALDRAIGRLRGEDEDEA